MEILFENKSAGFNLRFKGKFSYSCTFGGDKDTTALFYALSQNIMNCKGQCFDKLIKFDLSLVEVCFIAI